MISRTKKAEIENILFIATIILVAVVLFVGNILVVNTSDIINLVCIATLPFLNVSGIMALVCFFVPVNSGITAMYVLGYATLVIIFKEKRLEYKTIIYIVIVFALEIILCVFALFLCVNFLLVTWHKQLGLDILPTLK